MSSRGEARDRKASGIREGQDFLHSVTKPVIQAIENSGAPAPLVAAATLPLHVADSVVNFDAGVMKGSPKRALDWNTMRMLMRVGDVRRLPKRGVAIGGVNPAYDRLTDEEIKAAIGERVAVETTDGGLRDVVLEVTTSSSLIGQKNVFVLLPEEVDEAKVSIGARVLALN